MENYSLIARVFEDKKFIFKKFINFIILKLVIEKIIIDSTLETRLSNKITIYKK